MNDETTLQDYLLYQAYLLIRLCNRPNPGPSLAENRAWADRRGYVPLNEWERFDAGLVTEEEMADLIVSRCLYGQARMGPQMLAGIKALGFSPPESP